MIMAITVTIDSLRDVERRIDWLAPIDLFEDGTRRLFGMDGSEYYFPSEIWYAMVRWMLARPSSITTGEDGRR